MSAPRAFSYLAIFALGLTCVTVALGPRVLRYPDAMEYADIARGLARGDGALDRSMWVYQLSFAPGAPQPAVRRALAFPAVLAATFQVFGPSDLVSHATSAAFFLLCSLLVFVIAAKLAEETENSGNSENTGGMRDAGQKVASAGIVAGVLFLFDSHTLLYAVSGLSEPMFTFCMLLIVSIIVARPGLAGWLAVGLLVGASQWIRLNGLTLLIPAMLAAIALDPKQSPRAVVMIILGVAGPLLALAIRNHAAIGEFTLLGINGAISVNEVGFVTGAAGAAGEVFTTHGIERALYESPQSIPSVPSVLAANFGAFATKFWGGLDRNLFAVLTAGSPLAWGSASILSAMRWRQMSGPIRALAAFMFSTAGIWVVLFSTGEFEGQRFFVPLAPLAIVLAVAVWFDLARSLGPQAKPPRLAVIAILAAMILPGIYRLSSFSASDDTAAQRKAFGEAIATAVPTRAIVLTDAPWLVAWYADRTCVWLPRGPGEVEAVGRRSGATHLLFTGISGINIELAPDWGRVLLSRDAAPPGWEPAGGYDSSIGALYRLNFAPHSDGAATR